mgnify:CR=1 FL=1
MEQYSGDHCRSIFSQVLNYAVVVETSKKDLKLSERIYKCECGNVVDRDLQAALNLKKIWRGCSETICSIIYSSDYRYVLIR